eukprot:4544781-Pyramimonas_sp.AAC.2
MPEGSGRNFSAVRVGSVSEAPAYSTIDDERAPAECARQGPDRYIQVSSWLAPNNDGGQSHVNYTREGKLVPPNPAREPLAPGQVAGDVGLAHADDGGVRAAATIVADVAHEEACGP